MKKIAFLTILLFALSCDDGDIDVPEFVFDDDLSYCTSSTATNSTTYVFYKTNENEALSVEISSIKDDYFTSLDEKQNISLTGSNSVTYRTFSSSINGGNYFCQNIPPTEPTLVTEWTGEGTLTLNTVETKDDNDGIPAESEDVNGNGDYDDDDTDADGIPNYLDIDDDDDGILTAGEITRDSDGNLIDTDGDGTPNYLDDDDDGDGVLTQDEDVDGDGSLLNDDTDNDGIFNYLDSDDAITSTTPLEPNAKTYDLIYTTTLIIEELDLTNANGNSIRYEAYELGEVTQTLEDQPIPTNKFK